MVPFWLHQVAVIDFIYKTDIITDMRKLLVTLDDDLDKELAKYPNQNEIVREALRVYKLDISTDTVAGMRKSYAALRKYMETKFEYYDRVFGRLEKLISTLETRL